MAKRKRTVLCIEDKLCICTCASKGEKPASLAREFGVGKPTVTDILTNSIIRTFRLSKHSQGPMSLDNGGTTVQTLIVLCVLT